MNKNTLIGVLSVVFVFLVSYIIWQQDQRSSLVPSTVSQTQPQSIAPAPTIQSSIPFPETSTDVIDSVTNVGTYTSHALGITFQYQNNPAPVRIAENGNTIKVDGGATTIQVFKKDPSVTLQQAIQQTFLTGYDPTKCYVKVSSTPFFGDSEYTTASINYPIYDGDIGSEPGTCNDNYESGDFLSYFVYDPMHPNEFAYVNDGQSPDVMAPTPNQNSNFDYTLRFISQ